MGSCCGCQSQLVTQSATYIKLHQNFQQQGQDQGKQQMGLVKLKYQQISPEEDYHPVRQNIASKRTFIVKNRQDNKENVQLGQSCLMGVRDQSIVEDTENSIWKLNNQLSTLVCTFQQNNGQLTRTFLQHSSRSNNKLLQNGQGQDSIQRLSNNNLSQIKKSHVQTQKGYQLVTRGQKCDKVNLQKNVIRDQDQQNAKVQMNANKEVIQHRLPEQNGILSGSESDGGDENQSLDSSQECNQKTFLLDSSLKTDKQKQKIKFYARHNDVNGLKLQAWQDESRKALIFDLNNLKQLPVFTELFGSRTKKDDPKQDHYFWNLALTIIGSIHTYKVNHDIKLISYHQDGDLYGFRVFVNGTKRMIRVLGQQNLQMTVIKALALLSSGNAIKTQKETHWYEDGVACAVLHQFPLYGIYYLTGWIPECIHLKEITQLEGILERVNSNFEQGHTIITFSQYQSPQQRKSPHQKRHLYLTNINFATKNITVNDGVSWFLRSDNHGDFIIEWDEIVGHYDTINVNWNPSIYEHHYTVEGNITIKKEWTQLRAEYPQYHLKIPASKDDLQLRVFLQIHSKIIPTPNGLIPRINIELYDYNGFPVYNSRDSMRNTFPLSNTQQLHSDVFIFEGSQEKTQYLLVLASENPEQAQQSREFLYSLSAFCFTEISMKLLPKSIALHSLSLVTHASIINEGYSINSPNFTNNLQFSLQVPPLAHLRVLVLTSDSHHYDINVISDPQHGKDLAKINIENMLSENYRSCECNGDGGCEFISKYDTYLLVIAGYCSYKGPLKVVLEYLGDVSAYRNNKFSTNSIYTTLLRKSGSSAVSNQTQFIPPIMSMSEIVFNPKFCFQKQIKWSSINPGPRKRLKSNSTPAYHPHSTFQEFFRNPFLDRVMEAGSYQFNIISLTYQQLFSQCDDADQKITLEPPTLSLAVLRMSNNEKNFKIINDDAFYVPFGMGYWSPELLLEQGKYRFVMAKIEKDNSVGLFRIRKL